VAQVAAEESPESYAIGIADSRSDLFDALIGGLQQMHGTLYA
jgi:hypothetical protein